MISNLENLHSIFQKMAASGFPVHSELKWGFYFIDSKKANLKNLFDQLQSERYDLEEISRNGRNEFKLHVSKVEILTPEALHQRNTSLNKLASRCQVALYDGWDVEKLI